ncbi:hypothetical protein [Lichenibacterium ramalinae]|nr:hypothetical protein [Lichenibacterium ramalinae]
MTLENHDEPYRHGESPYPLADVKLMTSADRERRLMVRALIAIVDGVASARELSSKLGIPRVDAGRLIEMVLEYLELADFGVEGRGFALARLDIQGNRILLPLVLGPVSGRKRSMALSAYAANGEDWGTVVDQFPPVICLRTRIDANVTSAARSAAAPASAEAVEQALELMCERGEILTPVPGPSTQGFEVLHIRYALDHRESR